MNAATVPIAKMMAVRVIDLADPISDLTDVGEYAGVRLYVCDRTCPVGFIDIRNDGGAIGAQRIREEVARYRETASASTPLKPAEPLPSDVSVSIIITTCDRPDDLTRCLSHLQSQRTSRNVEIIVADNRPASGLTQAVVAEFPGVRLVAEPRSGASYGRNAAIAVSTGDIVVSVDDDVVVPADWLEKLLAPFARAEVMVVTGNVLPLELETPAQLLFETLKGGLSQGFVPIEANRQWLDSFPYSPPTWRLGVGANIAFRATVFQHPEIGLMDEVLGPGTPTVGGGEETHFIYKVLRAGCMLVYEPAAFVWHRHRRDMKGLCRQIHGHTAGGTAYHLLIWLQEGDERGRSQVFAVLPRHYVRLTLSRLLGRSQMPWPVLWGEVTGFVRGIWGYWKSTQRVKKLGRSAPYVPVSARGATASAIRPASAPDEGV